MSRGRAWWRRRTSPHLADETWERNFPELAGRAQREPALRQRYRRAYTMGMGTILQARRVLLLASGAEKRQVLREALQGPLTTRQPGLAAPAAPAR